ncbi:hypothetical protein D9758_011546 [Tetrapyrgos nigripes]|uniref:DUF6535 domain-containing protein n=1 Tax=Tetrapyrgos nigripes TaxID=182062 RepID=A0A8H5CN34_9AGAR|nr:hypothetical protein D9758_011546 [Tetrapyrgos nigripes]
MKDPQSQREIFTSVPNIPQLPEEGQNSLSDAEKGQAGITPRRSSGKPSVLAVDNVGREGEAKNQSKLDLSGSVPTGTVNAPMKSASVAQRDSHIDVSRRSHDTQADSEVRNFGEEKSKSLPRADINNADETPSGLTGKPTFQRVDEQSEGGKLPGNLCDSVVRISENLETLLSLITERNNGPENVNTRDTSQKHVTETEKMKGNLRRLLGIPEYQSLYTGNRDYDYTRKYPQDEFGKEVRENARVWKVYLDEAEAFDDEMLKGFRDTLDALLVFAALFSAVVTSFVISTVVNLQPDYTEITARLMVEQNQLLRAAGNATVINAVPEASVNLNSADVSTKDLWINSLFFASLSLSLATALLSVLVKQWLQAYNSSLPTGNACERAKIRQFRYLGFKQWKVPEIIGILPIILHASLGLFMVGLSVYVSELQQSLCWIVVSVTVISFLMYFGSIIIPVIHIQCPYRIPILFAPLNLLSFPVRIANYHWQKLLFHFQWLYCHTHATLPEWPSAPNKSLMNAEAMFLKLKNEDEGKLALSSTRHHIILGNCLKWLQSLQSNDSIQQVVYQAVHGVFHDNAVRLADGSIWRFHSALECYVTFLDWKLIEAFIWSTLQRKDETDNHKVCLSVYGLWRKAKQQISHLPFLEPTYTLHDAAVYGHLHIVKALVEHSAYVNAQGGNYGFALHAAALCGHLDIVKYLVEKGANVNAKGGKYGFALHAAATEDLGLVKYLVEKGANVHAEGGYFGFALQAAARWGHLDIVKYLVENGADVNAEGGEYGFALQAAAYWGKLDVVKYFGEKGANVNAKGGYFGFALHAAARCGHLDIVKYLVENGADANAQGGEYGFALQAAAYWGRLDIIKYFVEEKGVDVNVKGGKYGSALRAAQEGGEPEIVKYLQKHRATE